MCIPEEGYYIEKYDTFWLCSCGAYIESYGLFECPSYAQLETASRYSVLHKCCIIMHVHMYLYMNAYQAIYQLSTYMYAGIENDLLA